MHDFINHFSKSSNRSQVSPGAALRSLNSNVTSAYLPPFSCADLHDIIFRFKRKKAPGIDCVCVIELQRTFSVLCYVFIFMLNSFMEHGFISDKLKITLVKPLNKGGSFKTIENYRPLFILPCIAQIFEKHLFRTMSPFLKNNNLLSDSQFGFRAGKSTRTLLEEFCDHIYSSFDNNEVACALFLDANKAFDSFSQSLLLKKLELVGFRGSFS